jgi:hypothetical protein
LEIPEQDTTMNIEIICPTNYYSKDLYDTKRPNIFLIKKNNQFEPIFSILKKKKKIVMDEIIGKNFSEFNKKIPANIKVVLNKIIKPIFINNCKPLNSLPKDYHFYLPVDVQLIIKEISKKHYILLGQVSNLQGKIIGIMVENVKKGIRGVVPCNPSAILNDLPLFFMDENIWNTFENTYIFLNNWYKKNSLFPEDKTKQCNPYCIVVEDEQVIGFLTNTNQFIPISKSIPNLPSLLPPDVKIIKEDNYLLADIESIQHSHDTRRENYIKKIKYETYFFQKFRNIIKILINKFQFLEIRNEIQQILENKTNIGIDYWCYCKYTDYERKNNAGCSYRLRYSSSFYSLF